MIDTAVLRDGLARICARAGLGTLAGEPQRLTGGAVMESWFFSTSPPPTPSSKEEGAFVLRRAPSLAFMEGRPYGHGVEAALIEAARAKGVTAPEVVAVLEPEDGLGSGFVMRALPGTADPKVILACDDPDRLLREAARDLARIHSLRQADVPEGVPVMDYRAAIADLKQQFMDAGGDRPIIALGLRWLEDNCPPEVEPVLNHGDYRMGNLLVEGSALTGVLDWEIAHFGDRHEDLAFGCMAVWRFARYDRPALGLGAIEDYLAAYEAEAGVTIEPARFRFWTIYRTVWWAMGCLKMAAQWRSGADRMLERVVISRRTSEQELDLLLLLEEDAPQQDRDQRLFTTRTPMRNAGEATIPEMTVAISEWLSTIKDKLDGHDRFQLAVARNALGIIARASTSDAELCDNSRFAGLILSGEMTLQTHGLLHDLRASILEKVQDDSPKYPALQIAMEKWPTPDKRTEQV